LVRLVGVTGSGRIDGTAFFGGTASDLAMRGQVLVQDLIGTRRLLMSQIVGGRQVLLFLGGSQPGAACVLSLA
jgi:hypothetical protein